MPDWGIKAEAAAYSGTCGENLTWNFDTSTGVLSITGTGDMKDYRYSNVPWYSYRSSIKSVTIGNGVTSIGYGAFSGCTSLNSITIPDSVTSIGDYAFENCDSLTSITIPNSVTSIGDYAFIYCTDLTSITIPNSVVSIGDGVFSSCTSLENVTIKDGTTSIGVSAFAKCTFLKYVHIPQSVTNIGTSIIANTPAYICSSTEDCYASTYADVNGYKFILCNDHGDAQHICTYGDPTWTWNGYSSASATFTCTKDSSHTKTVAATISSKTTAATCTVQGKTVYTATATLDGEDYTDTKTKTIPVIEHDYSTFVKYQDAHPHYAIYKCSCGAATVGTNTAMLADCETCYPHVHTYGEPTWTWNGYSGATAKFVCTKDSSHTQTATATITSATTAATCTASGQKVYTATVTFNGKTYTTAKTQILDKLEHDYSTFVKYQAEHPHCAVYKCSCGAEKVFADKTTTVDTCTICNPHVHTYGEPTWTWNSSYSSATAKFTCSDDSTHTQTVTAAIDSNITPATCAIDGQAEYTATVEFGSNTYTDTKTQTISATGHDFSIFVEYQLEHPHYAVYKCACGLENVGTETKPHGGCSTCDPTHVHNYDEFVYNRAEHPHYAVYRCSCDAEKISQETQTVDTCVLCNPAHEHNYKEFAYNRAEHPHYAVYKCACGTEKISGETKTVDTCVVCNPAHVHQYNIFAYVQREHPHHVVYKCICGEEKFSFETIPLADCTVCKPAVKELESIEIVLPPTKVDYIYKSEIANAGLQVKALYSDGSEADVSNKVAIKNFDTKSTGTKTATVEFEGKTANFTYTVKYAWWQWIIRILLLGFLWY